MQLAIPFIEVNCESKASDKMNQTGFFWHERCFWHGAGNFAFLLPAGGMVEPSGTSRLPEAPETKRRLKNLIEFPDWQMSLSVQQLLYQQMKMN